MNCSSEFSCANLTFHSPPIGCSKCATIASGSALDLAGVGAVEHAVLGELRFYRIPLPVIERIDEFGVRRLGIEVRRGHRAAETRE